MREVLFIVVIYGINEGDSIACRSLRKILGEERYEQDVYVHDNTKNNIFLAGAYNKAYRYAREMGYRRMVIIDDDTEITKEYVAELQEIAARNEEKVYVPKLADKREKRLSPFKTHGRVTAFNSGVVIPIKVMEKVGGFSENYPLDYSDYWFFLQLHRRGIEVSEMQSELLHELSINDYEGVTRERYLSLLKAENRFAKEEGGIYPLLYRMKLLCRAVKWTITGHRYTKETWRAAI